MELRGHISELENECEERQRESQDLKYQVEREEFQREMKDEALKQMREQLKRAESAFKEEVDKLRRDFTSKISSKVDIEKNSCIVSLRHAIKSFHLALVDFMQGASFDQ